MTTDTSELGLEALIVRDMTADGSGWVVGDPADYDRSYCVDLAKLSAFLRASQKEIATSVDLEDNSPTRQKFLARLQGEVAKRGIVNVLRKGIKHGAHDVELFYGTPTPGNAKAEQLYAKNVFSVTRQLRYSLDERAL